MVVDLLERTETPLAVGTAVGEPVFRMVIGADDFGVAQPRIDLSGLVRFGHDLLVASQEDENKRDAEPGFHLSPSLVQLQSIVKNRDPNPGVYHPHESNTRGNREDTF